MSAAQVNASSLREDAFDGGIVELQGKEAALLVQRIAKGQVARPIERAGFQLRPVRAERMGHPTLTRPSGTLSHPMGEKNTRERSSPC